MYVQQISFYMAKSRTFTNLILLLLKQSRRSNYYVDQVTAVFSFQRLICLSVRISELDIKILWILSQKGCVRNIRNLKLCQSKDW